MGEEEEEEEKSASKELQSEQFKNRSACICVIKHTLHIYATYTESYLIKTRDLT